MDSPSWLLVTDRARGVRTSVMPRTTLAVGLSGQDDAADLTSRRGQETDDKQCCHHDLEGEEKIKHTLQAVQKSCHAARRWC